jgi:hypothetical protein
MTRKTGRQNVAAWTARGQTASQMTTFPTAKAVREVQTADRKPFAGKGLRTIFEKSPPAELFLRL